jgi:hypothetical protein
MPNSTRTTASPIHLVEQMDGREGLGDVLVGARSEAFVAVVGVRPRGEHHHLDLRGRRVGAQGAAHLDAAAAGHRPVEEDQLGQLAARDQQGLGAVLDLEDLGLPGVERHADQRADGGVVFGYEDLGHGGVAVSPRGS